jgi:mono/diheme cytochrome c family protein
MVSEAISGKEVPVVPLVLGGLTGVLTFLSLCVWFGLPIIPSDTHLPSRFVDVPSPYGALVTGPAGPTDPNEQAYQATCGACHQATGQGVAGAFPPLAESEWVTGDPETPIRIVLAGLTGPVTVKGQTFNSLMPPPPGMDDAKIAQVVTFVRSHFGNKASAVDAAQVAAVRAALAGRAKPWTADELTALRGSAGDAAEKQAPAAIPAQQAPAASPAGAPPQGAPAAAPPTAPAGKTP